MVTETNFVGVFDERLYVDLNTQAANYMKEDPQIGWIPVHETAKLNAPQYKKPIYSASLGVKGVHKIGEAADMMETPKNHRIYDLEGVEANIYYDMNDMTMEGEYLAQQKGQEVDTWLDQAKQSYFKGVFTDGYSAAGAGQGIRLNDGIIEQATLVENFSSSNDALLDATGDVYLALSAMVESIPFRIRDGRRVIIGCDDHFRRMARKVLFRGATNQQSEFDMFFGELAQSNPTGTEPLVATPLIVSDKLFLNTKVGTTKTELDVLGTSSRLFAAVVDPSIIENAYSFFGLMGEDVVNTVRGVKQKWFMRLAGCVHEPLGVSYSEQITWA